MCKNANDIRMHRVIEQLLTPRPNAFDYRVRWSVDAKIASTGMCGLFDLAEMSCSTLDISRCIEWLRTCKRGWPTRNRLITGRACSDVID